MWPLVRKEAKQQHHHHHTFLQQPLLGDEARTAITICDRATDDYGFVFYNGDGEEEEHDREKELIRQNRHKSAATAGAPSCCCGCYHAAVTLSWILLSLLMTSQWTVFVYYPRVHGNISMRAAPGMSPYNDAPPAATSTTVTSTTVLSILQAMNGKDLRVVAIVFCLNLLTLSILGWVGISWYHRHLCKQRHATAGQTEGNELVKEKQQHHVYLRRSATAILVVLNIALALLLIDQRGLALLAMIACLVALLWSFAIVYCLDNDGSCREEQEREVKDDDELETTEHHRNHHQQQQSSTTTTAAPLVACKQV
jgi:hypothetical protein